MSSVLFNIFGYWCIYSIFREFYKPRRVSLRILYRIKILVMKQLVYRSVFIIVCANDVSKRPAMIGHLCFVSNTSLVKFLESGRHRAFKCRFMSLFFFAVQDSLIQKRIWLFLTSAKCTISSEKFQRLSEKYFYQGWSSI